MNERLKLLRNTLKISQELFAKKIKLTRSAISNYEKGTRNITNRVISDICREFNVNEEWFRNGNGEMFIDIDTISMDEYLKQHKASDLEVYILRAYFNIPFEERQHLIDTFKTDLMKNYIKEGKL